MFSKLGAVAQQIASGMTSGTLFIAIATICLAIFGYQLASNQINHAHGYRIGIGLAVVGGAAILAAAFA